MLPKFLTEKYRAPSFSDKLNQRLFPNLFDAYGMPKNTRYSHLGLMDVGFLGRIGTAVAPFSNYANLKAYWKFDELSGDIINLCSTTPSTDCLTANDDLVVTGATHGVTGKIGKALSFDGIDDETSAANFTGVSAQQKLTVNGWFKQDVIDLRKGMFEQISADTTGDGIACTTFDDGFMYSYAMEPAGSDWGRFDYSVVVTAGTYFMYTYVYDGSLSGNSNRLKVFIDSVQQTLDFGANTIPATIATFSSRPWRVGKVTVSVNQFWNGDIDELSFWQRAFTQAEIDEIFNGGDGLAL